MKRKQLSDRKNNTAFFRSFFLLAIPVALALWYAFLAKPSGTDDRSLPVVKKCAEGGIVVSQASMAQLPSDPMEQCRELISYVVKPGDTFLGIFERFGLSGAQAADCFQSLASLGLFSLFPGDSLVVTRLAGGTLSQLSLLQKLQCWYNASVDSLGIKASKVPVAISSQRCLAKGIVTTSLSESMNEIGIDDACVSKFADIFAWDINFFVDPKAGDTYRIVFEKKFTEGRFVGYGEILTAQYVNNGRVFNAIGVKDDKGIIRYFDPDGKSLQKQFLKAPLRFNHISSRFSYQRLHPVLGIVRPHLGVDYAAPAGTPVYASADGTVRSAGYNGGFGNQVCIRHGSAYETSYGHLRAFATGIRPGKRVVQGELIGFVGGTGLSTGAHLDYRMTRNNQLVNPSTISIPAGKSIAPEQVLEFGTMRQECAMLFDMRLPGKTGAWVLDISRNRTADSVKTLVGLN